MNRTVSQFIGAAAALALGLALAVPGAAAKEKKDFKVAWPI